MKSVSLKRTARYLACGRFVRPDDIGKFGMPKRTSVIVGDNLQTSLAGKSISVSERKIQGRRQEGSAFGAR
jgi:hypothetical protein